MGCGAIDHTFPPTPIKNSFLHLLQTNQTPQVITFLDKDPSILTLPLNYRGDLITHYACSKNNIILINYLFKVGADFAR